MSDQLSLVNPSDGVDNVHLFGSISMLTIFLYVIIRYEISFPLELLILGVAFTAYLLLVFVSKKYWLYIRYIDWFITVPLLVYVVSEFGNRSFVLLLLPVIAMLLSGFIATFVSSRSAYNNLINLGFIFFIVFFILLVTSENTLPWPLLWVFFGSWALYGFVDRLEGPKDHWAYTALDIFNKPIFIVLLLLIIA
jgi:hypothetical protein